MQEAEDLRKENKEERMALHRKHEAELQELRDLAKMELEKGDDGSNPYFEVGLKIRISLKRTRFIKKE